MKDKFIDLFLMLEKKDERTYEQLDDEFKRVEELIQKLEDMKNACRRGTSERDRYAGALKNLKKKMRRLETLMSRLGESRRSRRGKSVLSEGGLGGHINHLYENWNLTFNDIMEVFRLSARGELEEVSEKVDGMNLFISWSMQDGVLKAARNNSHIKQGGLNAEGLANKFEGRGQIHDAFVNAFNVLESAIERLDPSTRSKIFGSDADVWYSIEVMFVDAPNVIVYDKNNVVFHRAGSARFDKTTGKPTSDDISEQFETLTASIKSIQDELNQESWNIVTPTVMNLRKLTDDEHLNSAISQINDLMSEYGLNNGDTIGFYIKVRLSMDVLNDVKLADSLADDLSIKEDVIVKMMGDKSAKNIRDILKSVKDDAAREAIKDIINNSAQHIKTCTAPLETIIREFSIEVLRGLESAFIIDNDAEIQRIRKQLHTAIDAISSSGQEDAMNTLKSQMSRLKDIDSIASAMEGIVFTYKGHTYKYTGDFAVANQILGLFRYGRGGVPKISTALSNR